MAIATTYTCRSYAIAPYVPSEDRLVASVITLTVDCTPVDATILVLYTDVNLGSYGYLGSYSFNSFHADNTVDNLDMPVVGDVDGVKVAFGINIFMARYVVVIVAIVDASTEMVLGP